MTIFAIGLCAYAVMHNHYHAVLSIDKSMADDCDSLGDIERCHQRRKQWVHGIRTCEKENCVEAFLVDSLTCCLAFG